MYTTVFLGQPVPNGPSYMCIYYPVSTFRLCQCAILKTRKNKVIEKSREMVLTATLVLNFDRSIKNTNLEDRIIVW